MFNYELKIILVVVVVEVVVVVVAFIVNSHKMDFKSCKKLYNPVNKKFIQHSFIKSLV